MKNKILLIILSLLLLVSCGGVPEELEWPDDNEQNISTTAEPDGVLHFRFIDVGQGDATLLTTPSGKQILIDAGLWEMGKERVLPLISNLDLIIASHYDADHIGGIPEIIKGPDGLINTPDDVIPTRGVLDRGEPDAIDSTTISNYFIITSDIRYSLEPGATFTIDNVKFTILAQNGEFKDGTSVELDEEHENAHSLSLLIEFGEIKYLTSGDLPGPNFPNKYEPYDLEQYLPPITEDIDILHVSHHGSHNSTNDEFIEAVRPEIAIISFGENDYGHPHPVVIENLQEIGTEIYTTENGDICIETDGLTTVPGTCLPTD